jgi:hypothetical protein
VSDYDFYLRHASVRSGAWAGFALARKGRAGVPALSTRPHLRTRPWVLDPANPNDPALGSWGVWQWRFQVALFEGLVGLQGTPPTDGRTGTDMRADLLAYIDLPALELQDADGTIHTARATAFEEHLIEPYDAAHPDGGWTASVEFSEVSI